eukprot:scaffold8290_cov136-Isochrysis_galbana.AAC.1
MAFAAGRCCAGVLVGVQARTAPHRYRSLGPRSVCLGAGGTAQDADAVRMQIQLMQQHATSAMAHIQGCPVIQSSWEYPSVSTYSCHSRRPAAMGDGPPGGFFKAATSTGRRPSQSVHGLKYDNVIATVADVIAN